MQLFLVFFSSHPTVGTLEQRASNGLGRCVGPGSAVGLRNQGQSCPLTLLLPPASAL